MKEVRRVHLIVPPLWEPYGPLLNQARLLTHLKRVGIAVLCHDWNLDFHYFVGTPEGISRTLELGRNWLETCLPAFRNPEIIDSIISRCSYFQERAQIVQKLLHYKLGFGSLPMYEKAVLILESLIAVYEPFLSDRLCNHYLLEGGSLTHSSASAYCHEVFHDFLTSRVNEFIDHEWFKDAIRGTPYILIIALLTNHLSTSTH